MQDRHTELCERAVAALAQRIPEAGIGVTGSFAAGRHRPDSDLDLLVVSPTVARDWQLAVHEQGIRVNVLCVHPDRFAAQLRSDATCFAAIRASYVLSARTLHDPHGHVAGIQEAARDALALRETIRGELLAQLHETARSLRARSADGVDFRGIGALWAAVEGAHLRGGRVALDKAEGNRPFDVLQRHDPELHAQARAALEGSAPLRATVDSMIEQVFGAEAPQPDG